MPPQPGGMRGQQPLTILAIDADATEADPESALLGTDFTFFTAFLRKNQPSICEKFNDLS